MKKIGLFCLCLASLGLVGCFHIPDEDWLPSRYNKVKTGDVKKDIEFEQAIDSIIDGVNMISSDRDEIKDGEGIDFEPEEVEETTVDIESENVSDDEDVSDNEEVSGNKIGSEEIDESFSSED